MKYQWLAPERTERTLWLFAAAEARVWGRGGISVDTKKKELVGDFKNAGREWIPQGHPEKVRGHDFIDKELGKAAPYSVYDLTKNNGWGSVGIDHDTAALAVISIRKWWRKMGRPAYAKASHLLITTDSGGSNGSRSRLWKVELQKMANQTGLTITVCHFPPGTSKWNKIEHRRCAVSHFFLWLIFLNRHRRACGVKSGCFCGLRGFIRSGLLFKYRLTGP